MSITFAPALRGNRPEVNLANGNAAALLDLLGLRPEDAYDMWGEADAADFLGRVLLALALLDVTTDDVHGKPAVTERNWTDCGRRHGYLAEKLAELHEVGQWAAAHHTQVVWG